MFDIISFLLLLLGWSLFIVAKSSWSGWGMRYSGYRCWRDCGCTWLCCGLVTWCSRCLSWHKVCVLLLFYMFSQVWQAYMSYMICFRFVATHESYAHPIYKRKLIEYEKTEYTDIFGRARWPSAPHRVLETPFFDDWRSLPSHENEVDQPIIGRSTIHGVVSFILTRFPFPLLYGLALMKQRECHYRKRR